MSIVPISTNSPSPDPFPSHRFSLSAAYPPLPRKPPHLPPCVFRPPPSLDKSLRPRLAFAPTTPRLNYSTHLQPLLSPPPSPVTSHSFCVTSHICKAGFLFFETPIFASQIRLLGYLVWCLTINRLWRPLDYVGTSYFRTTRQAMLSPANYSPQDALISGCFHP